MPKKKSEPIMSKFTMPGEVINYITGSFDKRKKELVSIIHEEIKRAIRNMDFSEIVKEALEDTEIELNATLKLKPKNVKKKK